MPQMLGRFRRPGGFHQLLLLLESCDPSKQTQLLRMIAQEDPGWAYLAKLKLLSVERVMAWPTTILMEVLPQMPLPIVINLYCGLGPEYRAKIKESLPKEWRMNFERDTTDVNPKPEEKFAAGVTLLQTVRDMSSQGLIKFNLFDPELEIDHRIVA